MRTLKLLTDLDNHGNATLLDETCIPGTSYGDESLVCIAVTDVPGPTQDSEVEFMVKLVGKKKLPVKGPSWQVPFHTIVKIAES